MIKQFTPRPGFRSRVPSFLPTLTPSPRSARRQGQAWLFFAVLFGLGQAAHAAGGDPDLTFGGDGLVITDLSNAQRRDQANDLAIQFDDKIVVVGVATRDGDENVAVVRYKPDGTPDEAFGQQGVAIVDVLADEDDSGEGIVLQRDGKIVVVGRAGVFDPSRVGNPGSFLVTRLNLDGTLDPPFGGGQGFVTTRFGPGSDDFATAVVLQSDGRIVAAGRSNAGGSADFALARYNTDGSLDDGGPQDSTPGDRFGANGLVLTDFAAGSDRVLALALDADGRLVAAGCQSCESDAQDFALARYLSDGRLDPSFDGDGKVTTPFTFGRDIATGVAIQARDGKIVAGGGADRTPLFGVARYLPDGRLDPSFDGDGRITTDFGFANDQIRAVLVQPDGRIVAAGQSNTGGADQPAALALAQYRTDGSLDNDFGSGGKVLTCLSPAGDAVTCDGSLATLARARAVVLQRDGKLVVAGLFAPRSVPGNQDAFDFLVARYNPSIVVSEVRRCQGKTPDLFGSLEQTTLRGTPGGDVILGSTAGELIIGGGGNDIICGEGGDDLIFGQLGRDKIDGGPGNDRLVGGANNDILRGGPGNDTLVGRSGDDELRGNAGNDELIGDSDASDKPVGNDRLIGSRGEDRMFGGPGSDVMLGGRQNDRMVGGRGADRANGGSGEDECFQSETLVSCKQTKPRPGRPRPIPSIPPACNFPGCGG